MPEDYKGRNFVPPDVPSGVHDFSDGYLSFRDTDEPERLADIAVILRCGVPESDVDWISLEQIVECVGRAQGWGKLCCFLTRWEAHIRIS